MGQQKDSYVGEEAKRRFEIALRGGLSTPPQPLKTVPQKRDSDRDKKKPGK